MVKSCTATSLQYVREIIGERSMRSKPPTWRDIRNAMTNRKLRLDLATEWFPMTNLLEPWVNKIPSDDPLVDVEDFLVVYFGGRCLVVYDQSREIAKALET